MRLNDLRGRRCETRKQRRRIVLSCEGEITEIEYFNYLRDLRDDVYVDFVENREHKSAPDLVLKDLINYLRTNPLKKNDEAWMVIDRDDWPPKQIEGVIVSLKNIKTQGECFLAMTNPKIEFWILLHFEDGNGVSTAIDCDRRLKKKYMPNYKKHIRNYNNWKDVDCIKKAIERARKLDVEHCEWPQTKGSTLYRLVEKLLPEV